MLVSFRTIVTVVLHFCTQRYVYIAGNPTAVWMVHGGGLGSDPVRELKVKPFLWERLPLLSSDGILTRPDDVTAAAICCIDRIL